MATQYNTVGVPNNRAIDSNVIKRLETILPKYVIDNDPTLVSRIQDIFNKDFILLDKGKLAVPETQQVIALQFPTVKPGDLITAELINAIMRAVESLDKRVAALESGVAGEGSVVITEIKPSGPLHIGDILTVLGRNFDFSTGYHQVFIGDTKISEFLEGTNDNQLKFKIPYFQNVPVSGKDMVLKVFNQKTTDQVTIALLPTSMPLEGNFFVDYISVNPIKFNAGNSVDFKYKLKSGVTRAATFNINPVITVTSNQAQWQNSLQVLDAEMKSIPSKTIDLNDGEEKLFYLRIPSVPDNPKTATFTLVVNVKADSMERSSGTREFTVGKESELQDETISLNYSSARFIGGGNVTGNKISLALGAQAEITLLANFTYEGNNNYLVLTPELSDSTVNWTAVRQANSTPEYYQINVGAGETMARNPKFVISAGANASNIGKVKFGIRRENASSSHTMEMELMLTGV